MTIVIIPYSTHWNEECASPSTTSPHTSTTPHTLIQNTRYVHYTLLTPLAYLIILCAHGGAKIDGASAVPSLHTRAACVCGVLYTAIAEAFGASYGFSGV